MAVALAIAGGLLLLAFLFILTCFLLVFYSPKRKMLGEDEYEIPKGEIYEEFRERIIEWTKDIRHAPYEVFKIKSHDGLTLTAKYYEYKPGAPIEILFHGYRGYAERDLCGGVERCHRLGRGALIVDQRASGESEGHVITFGIRERLDCALWAKFAAERFPDSPLILTGISMGAATVMTALCEELPSSVVCVLADCGYTTPRAIISKVLRDIHLPVWLFYPAIKLGAGLFGRFNLEEASALEGVERTKIPVIFIHGDADNFVPYSMSEELYEACSSTHKRLVKIEGAGHGLAFPRDEDGYINALREFEAEANFIN